MALVFMNAFTGNIDAIAAKPDNMSDAMFVYVEQACRLGRAYDVATEMLEIMKFNTDKNYALRDCFMVPNKF